MRFFGGDRKAKLLDGFLWGGFMVFSVFGLFFIDVYLHNISYHNGFQCLIP